MTDSFGMVVVEIAEENPDILVEPNRYPHESNKVSLSLELESTTVSIDLSRERTEELGHELLAAATELDTDETEAEP